MPINPSFNNTTTFVFCVFFIIGNFSRQNGVRDSDNNKLQKIKQNVFVDYSSDYRLNVDSFTKTSSPWSDVTSGAITWGQVGVMTPAAELLETPTAFTRAANLSGCHQPRFYSTDSRSRSNSLHPLTVNYDYPSKHKTFV